MRVVRSRRSTDLHPVRGEAVSPAHRGVTTIVAGLCSSLGSISHPLSCIPWLHGRYPLRRYYGRSDSQRAALRALLWFGHEHRPVPSGLPDYCAQTSDHSVSNHRWRDRGSPGCPACRLCGLAPALQASSFPQQTRPRSPTESSSPCLCVSRRCYGLVVLVPLLSTPPCGDAVTVRYPTTLRRRETDFHRSVCAPSQAH